MEMPGMFRKACIALAFCAGTAIASQTQTLTTLVNFDQANGGSPFAPLIQGLDGNFYGTTYGGGEDDGGTAFEITSEGGVITIYSFCSQAFCADGSSPEAPLVQAASGKFYGTTVDGGAHDNGTIFEITSAGKLITLHSFCSQTGCTDGSIPNGLIQADNGNLYGTTSRGGTNDSGTLFEITPAGELTTLHNFCSQIDCADGAFPLAALVQATNGKLYGTTSAAGAHGRGTVFEISASGKLTTLYSFCFRRGCPDGSLPLAALIQGKDGNFYGTTAQGGAFSSFCNSTGGCGTIFEITPAGKLATLYSFCSEVGCTDGLGSPGLVQATDGNFYGTTSSGGQPPYCNTCGTVFEITPAGKLTTLYNFCSQFDCADGYNPYAGLLQAANGSFYGTTESGGTSGGGTVFRFHLPVQ